jgi:hypothetical protein
MAELIPSGVIQLPNFAEIQYKLDRQKQQDEMAVARDLAQYKRQVGQIAPGAMPLVQKEFDAWQNAAKKYAADQSAASFAELNNAYDNYSQAHGYAKFLNDTVKERDSMYYKDPTKWNIKVDDYVADSSGILNNEYASLDELVSATSNIPSLAPAKKYEFTSAADWSNKQVKNWDKTYKDLDAKGTGRLTPAQRDDWFKNVFDHQIAKDESSLMSAVLSEASLSGMFGDGPITNEDINRVMSNPDLVDRFSNSFYDRAKAEFDAATSLAYKTQYDINEDRARASRERIKDSEASGVPKDYRNLKPINPPVGTGFVYRIDNAPIRTADGAKIIGFGVVGGRDVVEVTKDPGQFDINPPKSEYRMATDIDKANLEKETGGAYNYYVGQEVSLPKSSGQQPKQKSQAAPTQDYRKKYNY